MLSENRLGVISLALCERQISYIYLCSTLEKGVHNIDDFKMLRSCFRTLIRKNCCNELIWVTDHCNRAAVSRNRYGVEKTVDTHKILINAIKLYVCLQEK